MINEARREVEINSLRFIYSLKTHDNPGLSHALSCMTVLPYIPPTDLVIKRCFSFFYHSLPLCFVD
jgi:hypothetical protein